MSIFRQVDYREVLRFLVDEKKKSDPSFSFSALASALSVQKTYLSKIMSGKAHLSTDQIYLLTEFFSLSKEQNDYLILLVEYEKTGLQKRKKILQKRIASIQLEKKNPKNWLNKDFVEAHSADNYARYYLDPFMTVMHLFFGLPEFGGDPGAIAKQIGLTERHGRKMSEELERLGLIERMDASARRFKVAKNHLQLSPDSPLNSAYYALIRLASAQQIMRASRDQRVVYSMTFSSDEGTKARVHEEFMKFLRKAEDMIKESPSQEVYQMNFDLFPWR